MALVKRNNGLFPSLPSFFDDFLTRDLFDWPGLEREQGSSLPAVNVRELEDSFEVEVAAPGMTKDDFKVEVDNNILTISSEKEFKDEHKDRNGNYTRQEFRYASFRRSFNIPENIVDIDKVKADYRDGILHLSLPKKEEAKPKPVKTIKIS